MTASLMPERQRLLLLKLGIDRTLIVPGNADLQDHVYEEMGEVKFSFEFTLAFRTFNSYNSRWSSFSKICKYLSQI